LITGVIGGEDNETISDSITWTFELRNADFDGDDFNNDDFFTD